MTAHELNRAHMADNAHQTSASVDAQEMENFAAMAADWWNPKGKFKPLHIMNAVRTQFIKEEICAHFDKDPSELRPLAGLRILDIGCGGGLLCEPLARLGAKVTGIDALRSNIEAAKIHAGEMGLDIDYRYISAEDVADACRSTFDVVMIMEVLEHVNDPSAFIKNAAIMLTRNGLMFTSTINRTAKAFALAIFGAEYVLNWLPKGTHQYAKFIKPEEMSRMIKDAGLSPDWPCGMVYNPLKSSWTLSNDTSVNYVVRSVNGTH